MNSLDSSIINFTKDNNIKRYNVIPMESYDDICTFLIINKNSELYNYIKNLNITNTCLFNIYINNKEYRFCLAMINNIPYILGFMWWEHNNGPIIDVFDNIQEFKDTVKEKTNINLDNQILKVYEYTS